MLTPPRDPISTANVAELMSASARHVVAPFGSLDHDLAPRAPLAASPLNLNFELSVVRIICFVLSTGNSRVRLRIALTAVALVAFRTPKRKYIWSSDKRIVTIWRLTENSVRICLDAFVKTAFHKCRVFLLCENCGKVSLHQTFSAALLWTHHISLTVGVGLSKQIVPQAFCVKQA